MSLLSRNELRIFISPQQVDLVRLAGRGKGHNSEVRAVPLPAPAPDETPWKAALAALDTLLGDFRNHKADAAVVLSNHFVRYVLIQHNSETSTRDEEQALIRHFFASTYGPAADKWVYRLSDGGSNDDLQVAAAIDNELQESLRSLFENSRLKLRAIQPHLMAAFNSLRREIGENAWFALVEPGMLCLARIDHGQWRFLRTVNCHDDWLEDLSVNILRAKIMTQESAADRQVNEVPIYVFAPGHSEIPWMSMDQGTNGLFSASAIQLLRPTPIFDTPYSVPLFAAALSG